VCLATVEGLGGLAQTAGESVVDESELENALERLKDGHLALATGGIGRDLDLGGRADLRLGIVFSVRLLTLKLAHDDGCAWRGHEDKRHNVVMHRAAAMEWCGIAGTMESVP
jgi:hypothetical protein